MLKTVKLGFPEKFFIAQCSLIILLFVAHLVTQSYSVLTNAADLGQVGSFSILNLDNESNLPAWYSACALFLCAVLAGVIACAAWTKKNGARYKWLGLGLLFSYLSLDESASLHEGLIPGVLRRMDVGLVPGQPFDWTPLGIALFAVVFGVYVRFWLKLPSKTRLFFALSAITFLLGAIGFEKVSHFYEALYQTENTIAYVVTCGIEEFLEMFGIALFNYALLSHLCEHIGFIKVESGQPESVMVKTAIH